MHPHLFLYGTLRPGHAPAEIAAAVAQLEYVGEATLPGLLYDLGAFPGAISQETHKNIHGAVYRMPEDEAFLAALDGYEEFLPELPGASLFVRVELPVALVTGEVLPCWVYLYNRTVEGLPPIEGGRWGRAQ